MLAILGLFGWRHPEGKTILWKIIASVIETFLTKTLLSPGSRLFCKLFCLVLLYFAMSYTYESPNEPCNENRINVGHLMIENYFEIRYSLTRSVGNIFVVIVVNSLLPMILVRL